MTTTQKIAQEIQDHYFALGATINKASWEKTLLLLRQVAEEAVKACKVERIDTEKNCKECEFDCIKEDLPACSNCNRGYGYNSALNNSQAKGRKWIEENFV